MLIDSVSALLDAARQLRLLETKQLDEAARELQLQFSSPKLLAKELLQRGWLTAFQINSLFNGRGKDLVLGPYILLERLGQGGMGQVFKARNWKLNRLSALKVIRKERLGDPDAVKRFYREVQAAAQLDHPNVVLAFDADQAGDTHYFAMEYVQGTDLSRLVKERGPLPVPECVDYIRQATRGLQHAFEQGLVHRDIKPSNLLLVQKTNTIKILDLGLALVRGPTLVQPTGMLTVAGAVMGTPDYIAPEQARNSRAADTRSDIYSLGCTCYYLLTGQIPYAGTSLTEKLIRHQLDPPPTLEHVRSDVPSSLVAVIHRMMAKDPDDRFQTPAEVTVALDEVLQEVRSPSLVTAASAAPAPYLPPTRDPDSEAEDSTRITVRAEEGSTTTDAAPDTPLRHDPFAELSGSPVVIPRRPPRPRASMSVPLIIIVAGLAVLLLGTIFLIGFLLLVWSWGSSWSLPLGALLRTQPGPFVQSLYGTFP